VTRLARQAIDVLVLGALLALPALLVWSWDGNLHATAVVWLATMAGAAGVDWVRRHGG